MGYKSIEITAGGAMTEIQYMQYVIDTITAIDSRITCNTTAAEQYADLSSNYTATFDISIDNKYILRLKRNGNNATNTRGYIMSILVNGVEYYTVSNRWWYGSITPTVVLNSCYFKVVSFTNSGCILLWIGVHHDAHITALFPNSRITGLIYSTDNIAYCTTSYDTSDLIGQEYYKCSDGSASNYIVNALNYAESTGKLSYIENAPIRSSGYFASYAKSIHACTTIGMGTSVALADGNKYFAVSSNAISIIDEDES